MGDGRDDGKPLQSPAPVELTPVAHMNGHDGDRATRRKRTGIGLAAIALVTIIAIVGVLVATRDDHSDHHVAHRVVTGPAGRALFAALGATTGAGSYATTFDFQSVPGPQSDPPKTLPCPGADTRGGPGVPPVVTPSGNAPKAGTGTLRRIPSCAIAATPRPAVSVTGHAIINTDPYRMVVESQVTGLGAITVRVDSTRLWETGGGNYGLDGSNGGPGSPLSGFANLVEGTLGPGQGALTMITLASPNGYLHLEKAAVLGVTADGSGTIDGAPVTYYEVDVDPAKLLDIPGLSSEQVKTINDGLQGLKQADYRSTRVKVAVDDAGFIRQTSSVATFADGSRMISTTALSSFGCAGVVRLPGDPPADTTPTAPCVSPDTGTTTTSTSTSTTTTTTVAPPTTVPNAQTSTQDSSTTATTASPSPVTATTSTTPATTTP